MDKINPEDRVITTQEDLHQGGHRVEEMKEQMGDWANEEREKREENDAQDGGEFNRVKDWTDNKTSDKINVAK